MDDLRYNDGSAGSATIDTFAQFENLPCPGYSRGHLVGDITLGKTIFMATSDFICGHPASSGVVTFSRSIIHQFFVPIGHVFRVRLPFSLSPEAPPISPPPYFFFLFLFFFFFFLPPALAVMGSLSFRFHGSDRTRSHGLVSLFAPLLGTSILVRFASGTRASPPFSESD